MPSALLYNSRADWVKRHSGAPDLDPDKDYNTDTMHKASLGTKVKKEGRSYGIVRSKAPRWAKSTVSMRDPSYDQERAGPPSLARAVEESAQKYSNVRSDVGRWEIRNHTLLRFGTEFRRPDKQEHHMIPRGLIADRLLAQDYCRNIYHDQSIKFRMDKRPAFMANVFESTDVRNPPPPRECGPALGPGAYDPVDPRDITAEGPAAKAARNRPKRITKAEVEEAKGGPPAPGRKERGSEFITGNPPHLGPGTYFRTKKDRDAADSTQYYDPPRVPFTTAKRFTDPPVSENYKRNGQVLNPRRVVTDWVLPYNPIYSRSAVDRKPFASYKPAAESDYMPVLDSMNKISLATKSKKEGETYAYVFKSNNERFPDPGSVLAASLRDLCPCTGPNVGPGSYEAKVLSNGDPPPFRTGQQRGDTRAWGDQFDSLRPRHLLMAQGHTAFKDTTYFDLKEGDKPPPKFKMLAPRHKRRKRHKAVPLTPRELIADIYGPNSEEAKKAGLTSRRSSGKGGGKAKRASITGLEVPSVGSGGSSGGAAAGAGRELAATVGALDSMMDEAAPFSDSDDDDRAATA